MTTAQVVETSVTVNNNSPMQDYIHPHDQTQPFEMTPGFKPFRVLKYELGQLPVTITNNSLGRKEGRKEMQHQ